MSRRGAQFTLLAVAFVAHAACDGSPTEPPQMPVPALISLSAVEGVTGTTVSQTLTGTGFVPGATIAVSGTGVTVADVTVSSSTSITAKFAIASDATLGDRQVAVTTPAGTSGSKSFAVNPPAPVLTSLSAMTGVRGTTVNQTLTGMHFVAGATAVAVSGSDISVSDVSVSSATSLTVNFVIGSDAAEGDCSVTATTAGGTSGAQTFTVTASEEPPPRRCR